MSSRKPSIKSPEQVRFMRMAGSIVNAAHEAAAGVIRPGVTLAEIDAVVDEVIASRDGEPLFKGHSVPGVAPFPAATCISVNEEVVHGIPDDRTLKEGDVVSVDVGVRYRGWCADAAVTWPVGNVSSDRRRLLRVTEAALRAALRTLRPYVRWSEVAAAIEEEVTRGGFTILQQLVGHGIGREMWEAPQLPNYAGSGVDFVAVPGLVLAIEPMATMTSRFVRQGSDGWTMTTADGQPAAHFEHTVAVTVTGIEVLTLGENGFGWAQ
ncbi:MAG TPA: type I methionyl aminopeptidase [Solirubrobacteraceae bacterium]|nr:type I methionyl aminopeptidase [Solirubrobacteraceae bacterium]